MQEQVRRGKVRTAGWVGVSRGLHHRTGTDPLAAWQLALPSSGGFTGLTAAAQLGWWLPPLPADLPVFAAQAVDEPRARRTGLRVTRHLTPPELRCVDGVRLVEDPEVLLACARHLRLLDLVVLVDSALRGSTSEAGLLRAAEQRRPGAPLLRRAMGLADGRSESPWESVLRLFHVACGIAVEAQHEVRDGEGGFVARGDLWLVGTHVLHEYDGAVHRERHAHSRDLLRDRRLGNIGWTRRGYTSLDLLHRPHAVLREADLSLGRPHDAGRLRSWYQLLAESLHTESGRRLFRERLGLDR